MIGTLLSHRYRLESKLGSGGMSTVYLATDTTLEREVAIKILHREISDEPDQLERFRREARAVAGLSHPNVVAVIDAGEDEGHPYIVFEYVPGETLKRRIEQPGRLPLDEAAAYAIEIGRGLAAAHARRLVHRDVKPQNVLIDADGRAKITDFGIARSLESDGLTATGRVLGTTDYVAPEQAMGHMVDARSDLYSLGIVIFEMLTGDVPFKAETQVGVAMKHVNEALPDVQKRRPDLSSALAAVIDRATAKEPDDRYATVEAMLHDLEGALEVEVIRAGESHGEATTVLRSVPLERRRIVTGRRISWAGIILVLVAGAVALLIASGGEPGPSQEPASGGSKPVKLVAATDFDPTGGDGEIGSDGTPTGAIDRNPSGTRWNSEHYASEDFGGLKDGVGLYVDGGGEITATEVRVRTVVGGWDAEIYASPGPPPQDLAGWGAPVATVSGAETDQTVDLNGSEGVYFLIWFTKLPESSDEGSTQFRIEVSDIRIFG